MVLKLKSSILFLFKYLIFINGEEQRCSPTTTNMGNPAVSCSGYKTIPTDIPDPFQVRILLMTDGQSQGKNYLETITEGQLIRSNLSNLDTLNLRFCHIQKIERGAFQGGDKITELTLSDNRIETLDPYVFTDLPNLERLFMGNNPLHNFVNSMEFPSLKLKWLGLSDCGISEISSNIFKNLKNLEELYLNDNKLKSLHWNVLKPLEKLRWMSLYGNPWNCDCQIGFLQSYFAKHEIYNYLVDGITCASAPDKRLVGASWNNLKTNRLVCLPIVSSLEQNNAGLGSDAQLVCEYSGYPKPEVKWIKSNKILKSIARIKIFPEVNEEEPEFNTEFRQILSIKGLKIEDEGNYICLASNPAGNFNKSVQIRFPGTSRTALLSSHKKGYQMMVTTATTAVSGIVVWVVVLESFTIILLFGTVVGVTVYFRRRLRVIGGRWY